MSEAGNDGTVDDSRHESDKREIIGKIIISLLGIAVMVTEELTKEDLKNKED